MQTAAPTTWDDVLRMPEDGNRYEFIGGRLYITPAPVTWHQLISKRLQWALMEMLEHGGHGQIEDVVDVWGFGRTPSHERFTGKLPVRLGAERVGTIDLD